MRSCVLRASSLLVVLALAGCTGSTPRGEPEADAWFVYGIFTTEWTAEDEQAVCIAARPREPCTFMESLPPQFGFGFTTRTACEDARLRIDAVAHTIVRECAPDWQAAPYGVAQWRFNGTFAPERTDADVRAVCLAGARYVACEMEGPSPERFSFLFRDRELCDEARDKVRANERTRDVTPCEREGGNFPPEATKDG